MVHLVPGDYPLELTYWEGTGGASVEVFAARGAKSALDNTFKLVGNTAAGGLPLVQDPDTVPTFTANGGSAMFVTAGRAQLDFTLAWNVVNPTTTLSIDHGIGAVSRSGSMLPSLPSPVVTTTYTITATTPTLAGNDVATRIRDDLCGLSAGDDLRGQRHDRGGRQCLDFELDGRECLDADAGPRKYSTSSIKPASSCIPQ